MAENKCSRCGCACPNCSCGVGCCLTCGCCNVNGKHLQNRQGVKSPVASFMAILGVRWPTSRSVRLDNSI